MKYQNTTAVAIYIQVDGATELIHPGQELDSSSDLGTFGLTALPTAKPEKIATPKATPKEKKATPKPKPVTTNERKQFTNTDSSKD
tara:strand:+ start:196 stop:453 length:258 start_codon:yes stop_codon:yes gene_type:complete